MNKTVRAVGEESESKRFLFERNKIPFELVYPLYFVECNCTASQGEYLYNK